MITVHICAGSSCHLRGTYKVIEVFQHLIEERSLQEAVVLKGRFCMGKCSEGVNMEIDGQVLVGIRPEDAAEVFEREIVGRLPEETTD